MGNSGSGPREDEYESPTVKMEEKHFWPYNDPVRLRKNPLVTPCASPKECNSVEHYYEFKHWMTKEWMVYCQEILLVQEDLEQCLHGNRVKDPQRTCGLIMRHYLSLVSESNLNHAKKQLWKGTPLVDDEGWVYKFEETEDGVDDQLLKQWNRRKLETDRRLQMELLEKERKWAPREENKF